MTNTLIIQLHQECTRKSMSSYVCQPNHIIAAMHISCFIYTTILHVPLWLQVSCTVSHQSCPTKGVLYSIIHRTVATQFSIKSCTCTAFVWYLLCAVTPPSHNTNIHKLRTLLSTLLFAHIIKSLASYECSF